jgi:broad specificity phosphatase PhoE
MSQPPPFPKPSSLYEITFLRHGESTGNLQGVIQGQSDFPLTARGRRQAEALAAYWCSEGRAFDWIISSPQSRAHETAQVIAAGQAIETDPDWMERRFGEIEGLTIEEVHQADPPVDFYHPYQPVGKDGESAVDLYLRASRALQNLLRRPPGRYLVVSHGGLLNMTMLVILGVSPQNASGGPRFYFGNTAYANLAYHPEARQWRILSLNTQPHWKED